MSCGGGASGRTQRDTVKVGGRLSFLERPGREELQCGLAQSQTGSLDPLLCRPDFLFGSRSLRGEGALGQYARLQAGLKKRVPILSP